MIQRYGVFNIQTNQLEKTYHAEFERRTRKNIDPSIYIHFIIDPETEPQAYNWDGSSMVFSSSWTQPADELGNFTRKIVTEAVNFGKNLIVEFGGENVAMGITQYGKTAEVLSIMDESVEVDPVNKPGVKISLIAAISSGSLYEALAVIQIHIDKSTAGDYDTLAPFLTVARLTAFKQKILDYIS